MNKKTVESYFEGRKSNYSAMADFHMAEAKKAKFEFEKKYHEDRAWFYGISMQAILDDMEKDLKKLI